MQKTFEAVYEDGVLRPLEALGLANRQLVQVTKRGSLSKGRERNKLSPLTKGNLSPFGDQAVLSHLSSMGAVSRSEAYQYESGLFSTLRHH
jgi:predicted DNA-binding antitoxin AbrB/MazE fold protein